MWPFKKKNRTPEHLPIEGPWLVSHGKYDGNILLVRLNKGYRAYGRIPGYEHQVGIAVPLRAPDPNGLPSSAEDAMLGRIEDTLCASLEQQVESLIVAVLTTGGMREFVFYTRAPEQVTQRVAGLRRSIMSHEIQLMIQPDKHWKVYAQFA